MNIPQNATKIDVAGATVDFYTFMHENSTYYAFDTSKCGPPEPMVNAMAGLKMLDSSDKKLLMINHKMPMGLFDKIGEDFEIGKQNREDGLVAVTFGYKGDVDMNDPKYQAKCGG